MKRREKNSRMDLFEEEELIDDTGAKLVDYKEEAAQLWERSGKDIKFSMGMNESEDEYYAGKLISRRQLSSSESETDSESGRYYEQ